MITHKGRSMLPFVRENDIVHIKELSQDPQIGEVVLFYSEETKELTLHRLIDHFKTKGDWSKCDEAIDYNAIIGRLVSVERKNRNYIFPQWFATVIVFISKVGLPLLMKKLILTVLAKAFYLLDDRTILNRNKKLLANDL